MENSNNFIIAGNQLICAGMDHQCVPPDLGGRFGGTINRLDFSYNQLREISNLEAFSHLKELVLDNNVITDGGFDLPQMPQLELLSLNKNKLEDLDVVLSKIRKNCPDLSYLSLLGNIACPSELLGGEEDENDYQRYRYFVLYQMPHLRFLDSRAVTSSELKEAKRVGAYTKIVKPSVHMYAKTQAVGTPVKEAFSPLPPSGEQTPSAKATFGKCKYVYYGKHSEGNRFIRDRHL
ncbi:Leucine-rich repeat-containing protein C10 [Oopsacas minuta]|uniref:Leucine-rich repeat-containing protein C10 n=1 Tax=Oopsacas minuta TaxID=111878 RepID=A0AAV7KEI0_9METZ|nr:Leucine-rich repeat-containing protein C10 [Oopsacas minuta]